MLTLEELEMKVSNHPKMEDLWKSAYKLISGLDMKKKEDLDCLIPRIRQEAPDELPLLASCIERVLKEHSLSDKDILRIIALLCPCVMVSYMGVDDALLEALKTQIGFLSNLS